jgi:hypothetical protein
MWQQAAALRDFNPTFVRLGQSRRTNAATVSPNDRFPPKADK